MNISTDQNPDLDCNNMIELSISVIATFLFVVSEVLPFLKIKSNGLFHCANRKIKKSLSKEFKENELSNI